MRREFDITIDHTGLASGRDMFRPQPAKEIGAPSFSFAETDFPIPQHMQQAFHALVNTGFCGYTVAADSVYLAAIRNWMQQQRGWQIQEDWIIPVYGVLRTMSMALRAFTRPGEGVILLSPGYMAYEGLIENNARKLVRSPLCIGESRFTINWRDLAQKMADAQNTMLFLCNAHNPTMHVWSLEEMRRIAQLAAENNVMVVVDETFGDLCFTNTPMTNYGALPEAKQHCIIINALSKAFNITGLNAANAIIPDAAVRDTFYKTFVAEQRGSGSIEPFVRAAVIAGYSAEGRAWLDRLFAYVKENFAMAEDFFAKYMPQVKIYHYDTAYLLWVDWRALGLTDAELEDFLFREAAFCVDMGYKYGPEGSGFTRIHFGTSHANVSAGLERLKQAAIRRGFIKGDSL